MNHTRVIMLQKSLRRSRRTKANMKTSLGNENESQAVLKPCIGPPCHSTSSRLFSRADSSPTFRTPEAAAARRGRGRRRLCLSPTPIQSFADRSGFGMRNRATTTAARRRWRLREVGRTWDGRGMEGGRRGLSPSFKCLGRPSLAPRPSASLPSTGLG